MRRLNSFKFTVSWLSTLTNKVTSAKQVLGYNFSFYFKFQINRTLKVLNIESNFITGEGIIIVLRALENNNCLEELRFDNQRQQFGNKVKCIIIRIESSFCNTI